MNLKYLLLMLGAIVLSATLGCTSARVMKSNAIERGEIQLSNYKFAVVYDSENASFLELELEDLLEHNGLRVIGSEEVSEPGVTLGARYRENHNTNIYGQTISVHLTILLEDFSTDKTLITASGRSRGRRSAWGAVSKKLNEVLSGS